MKQNLQLSDPPLKLKNIALLGYINLISCFCLATGQSQRVITLLRKLQCVYCLHSVASPSRQVYTLASERALNISTTLQCFEHSNTVEIRNGIMFDFYPGLPHIQTLGMGIFLSQSLMGTLKPQQFYLITVT